MTGNYTQTTGGELLQYFGVPEVLNVNGNASLSGYLLLSIVSPKHPPKPGSTGTVMTFGSRNGEFTKVPINKAFSLKYDNNSLVATYQ